MGYRSQNDSERALREVGGRLLARLPDGSSAWLDHVRRHWHDEIADVCRLLALRRWHEGNMSEAIEFARRRLDWRPDDFNATKDVATFLANADRHSEAIELLEEFVAKGRFVDAIEHEATDVFSEQLRAGDVPKLPNSPVGTAMVAAGDQHVGGQIAYPPIFNVPLPRNPYLTGRDVDLDRLHQHLLSEGPVAVAQAIAGSGGVGKTQLVLEYAYRFAKDYDVVWWIPAKHEDQILNSFSALAARLGITTTAGLEVAIVRDWLVSNHRWLLVFDNAEEPDALTRFVPSGNGHILITSRRQDWPAFARVDPLDVLEPGDATAFLQTRTGEANREAAEALAIELGFLPLALEQAAAYATAQQIGLEQYLNLFRAHSEEMWGMGRPSFYDRTVATTWTLSFELIEKQYPSAAVLLHACSWLSPDAVPRVLFGASSNDVFPALADELERINALGQLLRYSLVRVSEDKSVIVVHRLVAEQVRARAGRGVPRLVTQLIALLRLNAKNVETHGSTALALSVLGGFFALGDHCASEISRTASRKGVCDEDLRRSGQGEAPRPMADELTLIREGCAALDELKSQLIRPEGAGALAQQLVALEAVLDYVGAHSDAFGVIPDPD
jgi:hypothetical protein